MKHVLSALALSSLLSLASLTSHAQTTAAESNTYASMPLAMLQATANSGNPTAQFYLANRYKSGMGVPTDLNSAFSWYLKAAEQGAAAAQLNVGQMYAEGRGVNRDLTQAKLWLQKAAKQGDNRASYNLALLEERQQNLSDAYQWYDVSARDGMLDPAIKGRAQDKIRKLAANLSPQDQQNARLRADSWMQSGLK